MSYKCKGDICVPTDLLQVGVFKGLQRAINDVLEVSRTAGTEYTGPIDRAFGVYVDNLVVDGKIGPKTADATRILALNIDPVHRAFMSTVYTPAGIAEVAGPLGRALAAVAASSYKPSAVPSWLWAASPPAAFAWLARSFRIA